MRYLGYGLSLVLTAAFALLALGQYGFLWGLTITGPLAVLGTRDLLQRRHNLLRNYPLLAHFRWMFESIRPEIRQYLLESDTDGAPFDRAQRSMVYRRATQVNDKHPLGTELGHLCRGLRVVQPLGRSPTRLRRDVPDRRRRPAMRPAQFLLGAQHLRDEFRLAVGERHSRSQQGRRPWWLRHDTGEGGISALSEPGPSLVVAPVDYRENRRLTERLGEIVQPGMIGG